jgi:hypothetical protein
MVAGSIASLKVATTALFIATPVAMSAGIKSLTVGLVVSVGTTVVSAGFFVTVGLDGCEQPIAKAPMAIVRKSKYFRILFVLFIDFSVL